MSPPGPVMVVAAQPLLSDNSFPYIIAQRYTETSGGALDLFTKPQHNLGHSKLDLNLQSLMAESTKVPPEVSSVESTGDGTSTPAARGKRKLGAVGSKSWFNKSFDQTVVLQGNKPPPGSRPMRRQSSVSDFFQSVVSKSKSHLQELFLAKKDKEKSRRKHGKLEKSKTLLPEQAEYGTAPPFVSLHARTSTGSEKSLQVGVRHAPLHSSCPSITPDSNLSCRPEGALTTTTSVLSREKISVPREKWETGRDKSRVSLGDFSATMNLFTVSRSDIRRSKSEETDQTPHAQYQPQLKSRPGHQKTLSHTEFSRATSTPVPTATQVTCRDVRSSLTVGPETTSWVPKIVTLAYHEPSDKTDEGPSARRHVVSAPSGRSSAESTSFLTTHDVINRTKRALVKSNSDTLAMSNFEPQPLAKASSDGNCFRKSPTSQLASSVSPESLMVSVTYYLFLGSIEAAYNEPLLCKYRISSLIDMTNIHPTVVPAHKKSDCPCACVGKTHFRSKLNIGVDDIEWENLEQYFEEINAFVHGARKKGGRVLIFSYMGQSRAAAATVQHLMHHFRMPYDEALRAVTSKWPQTKLNSGFVKALKKLEKRLGLTESHRAQEKGEDEEVEQVETLDKEVTLADSDSVEKLTTLDSPPVVKGAWLEC